MTADESMLNSTSTWAATVGDAMTRRVIVVSDDASLTLATRLMGEHRIRHLAVVDWQRIPIGIFSERDLFRFLAQHLAAGESIDGRIPVRRMMTEFPMTVQETLPLDEAARILDDQKIGCVLVVDADRRLMGILTRGDVLRCFSMRNRAQSGMPAFVPA